VTKVARLFDVSPVTYPAYPTTSVSARSKFEAAKEQPKPTAEPVAAAINAIREDHIPCMDDVCICNYHRLLKESLIVRQGGILRKSPLSVQIAKAPSRF